MEIALGPAGQTKTKTISNEKLEAVFDLPKKTDKIVWLIYFKKTGMGFR